MAIIYTYPIKTNPVVGDLVVITDSQDKNFTKQTNIGAILDLLDCAKVESKCGFCTTSLTKVNVPSGSAVEALDCGTEMSLTSSDGSILINGAGGNVIDLVGTGGCSDVFKEISLPGPVTLTASGCDDGFKFASAGGTIAISNPVGNSINLEAVGGGGGGCTAAFNVINGTSGAITTADCATPASFIVATDTNMTIQSTADPAQELEWKLGCATTDKKGGFIAAAQNNPTLEAVGLEPGRSYPVQVNDLCGAFVNVPWISGGGGDGCANVYKTFTDPDGGIITASGCDDNVTLAVEENSNLTIVASETPDTLTFGLGCATTELRGGIKIGAIDAEVIPEINARGTAYSVEVNSDCQAFVRVAESTTKNTSDTFKPILVTAGVNGVGPLVPVPAVSYSAQAGTWNFIGGQVYIDFYIDFTITGGPGPQGSLGIAAEDPATGTIIGLDKLNPGLNNLNTKNLNNAYVGITQAEHAGDAGTWNITPQAGKLNHYYAGSGGESVMWLYYWENPSGVAAAPLKTNYSPGVSWTAGGPTPSYILAGSCNPILFESIPELDFYWRQCGDETWNSQSLPYPTAAGINGPGTYWYDSPGGGLASPECYEVTDVNPGASSPGVLDTAYSYSQIQNLEGTDCDCCGEYFHYQKCAYGADERCGEVIDNYHILSSTMLGAIPANYKTITVDGCCYTLMQNTCEDLGASASFEDTLWPNNGGFPLLDLGISTVVGVASEVDCADPACEDEPVEQAFRMIPCGEGIEIITSTDLSGLTGGDAYLYEGACYTITTTEEGPGIELESEPVGPYSAYEGQGPCSCCEFREVYTWQKCEVAPAPEGCDELPPTINLSETQTGPSTTLLINGVCCYTKTVVQPCVAADTYAVADVESDCSSPECIGEDSSPKMLITGQKGEQAGKTPIVVPDPIGEQPPYVVGEDGDSWFSVQIPAEAVIPEGTQWSTMYATEGFYVGEGPLVNVGNQVGSAFLPAFGFDGIGDIVPGAIYQLTASTDFIIDPSVVDGMEGNIIFYTPPAEAVAKSGSTSKEGIIEGIIGDDEEVVIPEVTEVVSKEAEAGSGEKVKTIYEESLEAEAAAAAAAAAEEGESEDSGGK